MPYCRLSNAFIFFCSTTLYCTKTRPYRICTVAEDVSSLHISINSIISIEMNIKNNDITEMYLNNKHYAPSRK